MKNSQEKPDKRWAGSDERRIQSEIQLAASAGGGPARLWRNNTGALKDAQGQLVRYGLCPGSSDLIGFRTITITPDMVGQRVAVFTAVEVKDRGRPTEQQQAFINLVQQAGGLAGIARSVPDALAILRL
jgi:hypothetical protein